MSELNAQIPLSYVYGPTIGDNFKQAVSIADAMDTMRSRGVQRQQVQQEMQKSAYAMQLERESLYQSQSLLYREEWRPPNLCMTLYRPRGL
jgi:hypothetical protein